MNNVAFPYKLPSTLHSIPKSESSLLEIKHALLSSVHLTRILLLLSIKDGCMQLAAIMLAAPVLLPFMPWLLESQNSQDGMRMWGRMGVFSHKEGTGCDQIPAQKYDEPGCPVHFNISFTF